MQQKISRLGVFLLENGGEGGGEGRGCGRLSALLEHAVLHVEDRTHMLFKVVVVSVTLVTVRTLNWVVPETKRKGISNN